MRSVEILGKREDHESGRMEREPAPRASPIGPRGVIGSAWRTISNAVTRKNLVTHYVPSELAPLYFEDSPCKVRLHEGVYPYSTSVYPS